MDTAPTTAPEFQALDLFEHYEQGGHLLVVTSDASALRLAPGEFIVRRTWSSVTASPPVLYNAARAGGE